MTTTEHMLHRVDLPAWQEKLHPSQIGPPLLVDAHVHCHSCFAWDEFMNAAQQNFAKAAQRMSPPGDVDGCLLFTEPHGVCRFHELRAGLEVPGWTVQLTKELHSVVCRNAAQTIVVIAGRQIVTRERLEVLAIACDHQFVDGQPIAGIVQQVSELGGFAILPWGFGKWRLGRDRIVRQLLRLHRNGELALGDNGGRARMSRRPRPFTIAERAGFVIFPGSDPLPFHSEIHRVGSYGFVLNCGLDERTPAAAIVRSLRMMRRSPESYGTRTPLLRFAGLQLAAQWRKRVKREGR